MNEDKSFIKLHRKMLKWCWYDNINTTRLFIHLLLIANWEDKIWHDVLIKRGQIVTGRKKLSKETGLTEQQIRTSLNKLISTQEITVKKTNKYSIITINNYDFYQTGNQQITSNQPTNNQQITNNQPAESQQISSIKPIKDKQPTKNQPKNIQKITTTKEYKNIRNISNISNSNNMCEFVEENFGRTLNPIECETIFNWEDNELTRYAVKIAILNGVPKVKYIQGILDAYKLKNIKTVIEAQEEEKNFKNLRQSKKNKVIKEEPIWLNKKIEANKATKEEQEKIEEILKNYR